MKTASLKELARLVDGEVVGDGSLVVTGLNSIELAGADEITFVSNRKTAAGISKSKAAAFIVPAGIECASRPHIRVGNASLASAVIHNYLLKRPFTPAGISPSAVIGEGCRLSAQVTVGPLVCLGDRVTIGDRVTLRPGVVLGNDVIIGDDSTLHANVTVADGCIIGSRVIIHSGTVIGSDGYGYAADEQGNHVKRPQVGIVRIDDDVEIGANVCVDRAAFGETRIGRGVKIDNLVQVAHNVVVGENSLLVAMSGIAGSTTLGKNVVLGAQTGIAGHIHLDDGVMVAAKSGVHNSQKKGSVVGGIPAVNIKLWGRASAIFSRLPQMFRDLRRLRKKVEEIARDLEKKDVGKKEEKTRKQ